jgi:hypothetical protein
VHFSFNFFYQSKKRGKKE